MNYEFNKEYHIPTYNGHVGTFIGSIFSYAYNGKESSKLFDIFRINNFYPLDREEGKTAYCAINTIDECSFVEESREKLVETAKSSIVYEGCDYKKIKVGNRDLDRESFLIECGEASVKQEHIQKCLKKGYWTQTNSIKGEIKTCPTCNKIRQTSCCACGCGTCNTCGHRWSCSPDIFFPNVITLKNAAIVHSLAAK